MGASRIRLSFVNQDALNPRVIWVEPLGEDYTLRPGESLELIAQSEGQDPWFFVEERNHDSLVWLQGDLNVLFVVMQGERRLACGHNREFARSLPPIGRFGDDG